MNEAIVKIEIKCFRCGSQRNAAPVYCGTNTNGSHRTELLCERCGKRLQAAIQAVANDFLDSERRRE